MKPLKSLICVNLLLIFLSPQAQAMQTIFSVPSADVTPDKHLFVEEETQFNGSNPDSFFWSTTLLNYGIGHNTEIDTTLFNVGAPDTENMSVGVGFKSSIPIPGLKEKFPKREYKFTVGSNMLLGVQGNGVGNWSYATLSGRVPKINTRLTAGMSYGSRQVFGIDNTTAFIAGVEQPVTKKLNVIGDWYSGTEHWAGYLIVGVSYVLPKNSIIYAGYQIPNNNEVGNSGFVIEVGKLF